MGRHLIRTIFAALLAASCWVYPQWSLAKSAVELGREIIQETTRRDDGYGDFTAEVTMVLSNAQGQTFERHLVVKALEGVDDGEKRLFVFRKPLDIKGTAVLSHTHVGSDDDQWVFLPAFRRTKRISSANRTGAFVGSEFSYDDLRPLEVDNYQYRYLGDQGLGGLDCYQVEMVPTYPNSGYRRQIAFIDQANYLVRKIDYYDKEDRLMKTLRLSGYQQYLNKYWRPSETRMVNHQNHKLTVMKWKKIRLQSGLSGRDFDRKALNAIR